jgi:hypothetical protein
LTVGNVVVISQKDADENLSLSLRVNLNVDASMDEYVDVSAGGGRDQIEVKREGEVKSRSSPGTRGGSVEVGGGAVAGSFCFSGGKRSSGVSLPIPA